MTRFGFALDQRSCIGCHACTVACKQEHDIDLGVFRTWVKYIEEGTFPDTRRYFSVLRCNHCDDAPCVSICPTQALFRREDGIVDFDSDRCIGCKACMNACPYDALYIDPNSHTAAKCNFCAHRVDQGLKPSCEIVCPTQAIISGDLDDPDSEISRLIDTVPDARARARAGDQPEGLLPRRHPGRHRPARGRDEQGVPQRVHARADAQAVAAQLAAGARRSSPTPPRTRRRGAGRSRPTSSPRASPRAPCCCRCCCWSSARRAPRSPTSFLACSRWRASPPPAACWCGISSSPGASCICSPSRSGARG